MVTMGDVLLNAVKERGLKWTIKEAMRTLKVMGLKTIIREAMRLT